MKNNPQGLEEEHALNIMGNGSNTYGYKQENTESNFRGL